MGEVLSADEVLVMQTKAAQSDHAWPANHAFYMPEPCCEILTQWLYPVSRDLLALARSHEQLRGERDAYEQALVEISDYRADECGCRHGCDCRGRARAFDIARAALDGSPEGQARVQAWRDAALDRESGTADALDAMAGAVSIEARAREAAVRAGGNAADALRLAHHWLDLNYGYLKPEEDPLLVQFADAVREALESLEPGGKRDFCTCRVGITSRDMTYDKSHCSIHPPEPTPVESLLDEDDLAIMAMEPAEAGQAERAGCHRDCRADSGSGLHRPECRVGQAAAEETT